MVKLPLSSLRQIAGSSGLHLIGVAGLGPLVEDAERLRAWQQSGLSGEMTYMQRAPELLSDPAQLRPGAQSVAMFGAFYDQGRAAQCPPGFGRVARYAWGRDYHKVIRKQLHSICEAVQKELNHEIDVRVFTDSVPLLERAMAREAGLGFIGKNTMLIVPGRGSFLFLAEIVWNVQVINDEEIATIDTAEKSSCGACTRCLSACPTGAFVSERVLDARRCISYLTIEKRGALSLQERRWIGEWIFGCDICQEVCPFNHTTLKRGGSAELEKLRAEHGVGALLSLQDVLRLRSQAEFIEIFGGTPLARAKREGLLRNAAIVAANTCAVELLHDLIDVTQNDLAPLVRQHALWGASELARQIGSDAHRQVLRIVESSSSDPDDEVRQEALQILSGAV